MQLQITCPKCEFRFRVDAKFGGRACKCPNPDCTANIAIPKVGSKPKSATRKVTSPAADAPETVRKSIGSTIRHGEPLLAAPPQPVSSSAAAKPSRSREGSGSQRKARRSESKRAPQKTEPAPRVSQRELRRRRAEKEKARQPQRSGIMPGLVAATFVIAVGSTAIWWFRPQANGAGSSVVAAGSDAVVLETEGNPSETLAVAHAAPSKPKVDPAFKEKIQPFFETYCIDCHGPDEQMAGIGFHKYTKQQQLLENRKTWERIYRIVENGAMPPIDYEPRPPEKERVFVANWLDEVLNNIDCEIVNDPGRPTIRRLNRTEYNNTIRDLVGVDFQPAEDFPSDDVGEGFDNIGDVLSLSPIMIEKYLAAAEKITAAAIADIVPDQQTFTGTADKLKLKDGAQYSGDLVSMASVGSARFDVEIPVDGRYKIRVEASADQAGPDKAIVRLSVDDKQVHNFEIQEQQRMKFEEHTVRLKRGTRKIEASFINDYYKPKAKNPALRGDRNVQVRTIEVVGPEDAELIKPPEIHRRIVIATPNDKRTVGQAAREIFAQFGKRAFRRPVKQNELDGLVRLVETTVADGESFEQGVRIGMQAVLCSTSFLFRVESDSNPNDSNAVHKISDWELATRLSYFLWSTMPDDQLFLQASAEKLHEPDVLRAQIRRMLRDEKATALVDNFAAQWLNLRNLDEVTPDTDRFKSFNDALRDDMQQETKLLFNAVMKEDRSILDFLDADFTFLNQRLAKHYGIDEKFRGDRFKRVSLRGSNRAGVLTHASILTLTSNPGRTSPVKRGKWIMENILGTAPPPPPPDVPELEETAKASPNASLREQLAQHRDSPGCAACHKTMDAIGFGFENFNAVGQWRDRDGSADIDSSGILRLDGGEDAFAGPQELIAILKRQSGAFSRSLTEKMLVYALGRGLEYYDQCAVDTIETRLKQNGFRFSALVEGIVFSKPFLTRRGEGARQVAAVP